VPPCCNSASPSPARIDDPRGLALTARQRPRLEDPDVAARLRTEIGLRADVGVLEPGTLPRSERKTARVVDARR